VSGLRKFFKIWGQTNWACSYQKHFAVPSDEEDARDEENDSEDEFD
jgi:hypothetical protein